jgi:hypothetical protein
MATLPQASRRGARRLHDRHGACRKPRAGVGGYLQTGVFKGLAGAPWESHPVVLLTAVVRWQGGVLLSEMFDAVVVANGHFDVPDSPTLEGLENFTGRVMHARQYDTPDDYRGQRIVCVGYKSSGTDIARELSFVAESVHVVDRSLVSGGAGSVEKQHGNIFRRPQIRRITAGGGGVEFEDGTTCEGVDVIIFCTGYHYSLPFLSENLVKIGDRAVFPAYRHLFHAAFPSLILMGLLHSVVPFPLFDFQARWATAVLAGEAKVRSSERGASGLVKLMLEIVSAAAIGRALCLD